MRFLLALPLFFISNLAISQPREEVKQQLDSLVSYIKLKATESFALNTIYRGEDKQREWKDVYNPSNPDELKTAKKMLEKMKITLQNCNNKEFDDFKEAKESEGTWYVYSYACGPDKKIHFAFLKIGNKYVLGDIDVEE